MSIQIPLDLIEEESVIQVSEDRDDRNLAVHMKKNGQLVPVLVTKNFFGGKYRLVCGNRRLACAKILGWKTVEALVFRNKKDLGDIENEIAKGYSRLAALESKPAKKASPKVGKTKPPAKKKPAKK